MSYLSPCPTGTVFPYGGITAPIGWVLCDGSELNRQEYEKLFSVIGTNCGQGNGTTTFNVPDLRGLFLRGVSDLSGRDPDAGLRIAMALGGNIGNSVASIQGIATSKATGFQNGTKTTNGLNNDNFHYSASGTTLSNSTELHSHAFPVWKSGAGLGHSLSTALYNLESILTNKSGNHTHTFSVSGTIDAQVISGDNETRPINAYVNFILKV